MFSARIFLLVASVISEIYSAVMVRMADKQRKKTLPVEVADIYDPQRYQEYMNFVADKKKLRNRFKLISVLIDLFLIFSPVYAMIEQVSHQNPYMVFVLTVGMIWGISIIPDTMKAYKMTFGILEKYGMNKKDKKEFIKDTVIDNLFGAVVMFAVNGAIGFVGEHMAQWTHDFSIGYVHSLLLCAGLLAVFLMIISILQVISYFVMRKQYTFTPLEDGELKDKIMQLQAGVKKQVRSIYIYNESKKTTTKNAFLLKLFRRREFGIADNFINENSEDELLAVLSHEIGHLKHKKNFLDHIGKAIALFDVILIFMLLVHPQMILSVNAWVRNSFGLTVNNYYIWLAVFGDILTPYFFVTNIFRAYRSREHEYEADREAVKNGYGEALIRTFKNVSSDELVNVNPHPVIEFIEYDHPGMYQRIKAIREEEKN